MAVLYTDNTSSHCLQQFHSIVPYLHLLKAVCVGDRTGHNSRHQLLWTPLLDLKDLLNRAECDLWTANTQANVCSSKLTKSILRIRPERGLGPPPDDFGWRFSIVDLTTFPRVAQIKAYTMDSYNTLKKYFFRTCCHLLYIL